MWHRAALTSSLVTSVALAAQPGAVKPVAAPMRDLTWGQLNFLHTTDTHGWLGGHLQEPQYSADWGDYVSFSSHMRKSADDRDADLLLIDTGDRIEGNGLFDASTPKGRYQYDLYAEQNVDIICSGNHELYKGYSVDREHNTTIPNFKENYIASNLDYIDPATSERSPLAQRSRRFKTKNQGFDIIALGFLFNFKEGAENIAVQTVEDTIKEDWFQDIIKEKPDLFVIVGHVGLRMDEFKTLFKALRKENWDSPVVFFGGHSHVRDAISYGAESFAMASGRYLETIGWLSVDGLKKKASNLFSRVKPKFTRTYIDNNLYGMRYHTGLNEDTFPTEKGQNVSKAIDKARKELNLDDVYGCAPQDYWMSRVEYPNNSSIYSLITDQILPDIISKKDREDKPRLAIINTGAIRFDIFKGKFTRDSTFIVSPFTSIFKHIPNVPYEKAKEVLGILNSGQRILGTHGVESRFMAIPEQMFEMETSDFGDGDVRLELRQLQEPLDKSDPDEELTPGYVTKDDIGKDGDDTFHKSIKTYKIPNAIQAEIGFPEERDPEEVDVVFVDFVQPWILNALKLSGESYAVGDVKDYTEDTFTKKLANWVKDNWGNDC